MKIVVKNIENDLSDYLVYLMTDEEVNISAEFATKESLEHIIDDLIDESGEDPINVDVIMPSDIKSSKAEQPLVLVFYLDRELMGTPDIIGPFAEAVNTAISEREANAMAFFLPTDGPERIDCINPLLATPEESERITKLIDDIEKNFSIDTQKDD